jgi:LysR family transcriptional regulator, cys regulon transcriptional activator
VMDAFRKAGIKPKISLSAVDADICKTYVELGLGIAILADITVDPVRDTGIRARGAGNLFESSMVYVTVRPASYVRPYVVDFLQIIAPTLTPSVIREAMRNSRELTAERA